MRVSNLSALFVRRTNDPSPPISWPLRIDIVLLLVALLASTALVLWTDDSLWHPKRTTLVHLLTKTKGNQTTIATAMVCEGRANEF